jgi:hypothetical protein
MSVGSPESKIESTETYAAISRLPDDFRLRLGLSYREAVHALRVGRGSHTGRLHRARRRIAPGRDVRADPQRQGHQGRGCDRKVSILARHVSTSLERRPLSDPVDRNQALGDR